MSWTPAPTTPPRLTPAIVVLLISIVAALVFASAFEQAPALPRSAMCGTLAEQGTTPATPQPGDAHNPHGTHGQDTLTNADVKTGPNYFAGGLWSDQLGLSSLSELAVALKQSTGSVAAYSVSWSSDKLVVLDVSPISVKSTANEAPTLAVVSIDHAGPDPSPAFGSAIQKFVESLTAPKKVVVVPPLPGRDKVPDSEFPYDWTYLMVNDKTDVVDWAFTEPKPDIAGYPGSGYLLAWLGGGIDNGQDWSSKSAYELLTDTNVVTDSNVKAAVYFELIERGPYEVVPALRKALTRKSPVPNSKSTSDIGLSVALLLHRLLGVHADEYIDQAMQSDNPALRLAATRAIGQLADVTTDPIGKLTLLAEDRDMAVRSEALIACYKVGGRAAAGVAQLVGDYEMSENLRAMFDAIMPALLAQGEPIQPDSRANRLRRMAINELLSEERDALVCKVLLEREDLPDEKVDEVLKALAEAGGRGPLTALLNLLESMNPQALQQRVVLMTTLAGWATNELDAQRPRLIELINQGGRPADLHAATAAALIRSTPTHLNAVEAVGLRPALFHGIAWIKPNELPKGWPAFVIQTALSADPSTSMQVRVAALDALRHLPSASIKAGDVEKLLGLARTADGVSLRFAAIRAVNDLPASIKPTDIADLALTRLTIHTVPGKIAYDQSKLTVTAGRPVELTLINPDSMPHNLVITNPGKAQAIGMQVTNMGPAESAAINYIPQSKDILHHTVMIHAGTSDTLRFIAPAKPGNYDYICTFPGHFTTMHGVLEVVAP